MAIALTEKEKLISFSHESPTGLADQKGAPQETGGSLAKLSLAALGVVSGDIGTSPLYAIRECFHGEYGIPVTNVNILGVLSLMFWALVMIVTLKYLTFVLRADNNGEGGVIALNCALKALKYQ
jgi:KUP system potassium uptake protein